MAEDTPNGQILQEEESRNRFDSRKVDTGYRITPFVFEQGFVNGVLGVDTSSFEDFISATQNRKKTSVVLDMIRQDISDTKQEIAKTTAARDTLETLITESKFKIGELERQIKSDQEKEIEKREIIDRLEREKNRITPSYNLTVAIIFTIAGVGFMVAEIVITQNVFFHVLRFKDYTGWLLAFGIALSSIGIKPAVDRLAEGPYLSGKKWPMHVLLIITTLLALSMLGFLGYFRNLGDSYSSSKVFDTAASLKDLSNSINNSTSSLPGENSLPNKEFKPDKHWTIVSVFTISSILFAVCGAICFSISVPVFSLLHKKGRLHRTINFHLTEMDNIIQGIKNNFQNITQHRIDWETSEKRLVNLADLSGLERRLSQLQQDELNALEELYRQKEKIDHSWYQEGFARGSKYQLTGKLLVNPIDFASPVDEKRENVVQLQRSNNQETGGKYLHQRLRKLISYNFNRNQKLWNER